MMQAENIRKGILLAGGLGTRLLPMTKAISKQTLPVYDKPMIYYSFSLLMLANIREVLIVANEEALELYKKMFSDGSHLGMTIQYAVQEKPNGIAQALVIGENFIEEHPCALVLGDNIFYSACLSKQLQEASDDVDNATVFAYYVNDPSAYGVVQFDDSGKAIRLEEKPKQFLSNFAVPGMYFYPNNASRIAKNLSPSARGEYEITDVNKEYMKQGKLNVIKLHRGTAWLDCGTPSSLNDASNFVRTIQERTGLKIADLEEIAIANKWI